MSPHGRDASGRRGARTRRFSQGDARPGASTGTGPTSRFDAAHPACWPAGARSYWSAGKGRRPDGSRQTGGPGRRRGPAGPRGSMPGSNSQRVGTHGRASPGALVVPGSSGCGACGVPGRGRDLLLRLPNAAPGPRARSHSRARRGVGEHSWRSRQRRRPTDARPPRGLHDRRSLRRAGRLCVQTAEDGIPHGAKRPDRGVRATCGRRDSGPAGEESRSHSHPFTATP